MCKEAQLTKAETFDVFVSWSKVIPIVLGYVVTRSDSGTIRHDGNYLMMETGSPVWGTIALDIEAEINTLEFEYEFTSMGKAIFTAYFDDQLVYLTNEEYDSNNMHGTGKLSIGKKVLAGSHTLSFRIDPQDSSPSSVKIGQVKVFNISSSKFPWTMFLPAIGGRN